MDGVLLGWFVTFVIGVGVVLMLVVAAVLIPRVLRTRVACFYCPWQRRNVTARFVTDDKERPVGVVSCTAFADPMIVTCGAPCTTGDARLPAANGRPVADRLAD